MRDAHRYLVHQQRPGLPPPPGRRQHPGKGRRAGTGADRPRRRVGITLDVHIQQEPVGRRGSHQAEPPTLARDGANAAVIYSIGVFFGCGPCVVGTPIEANWAAQANSYYGRGKCAKIYYILTITEYGGGYCI